jgi:hypothetical protein
MRLSIVGALALLALTGCGAPAQESRAPSRAELDACLRAQQTLERRLAAAEGRIQELEEERDLSPSVVPIDPPDNELGRAEEIRLQFPRVAFETLFHDQAALMKSARVVPALHDGRVTGLRLLAMRAGSPLAQLGFENGDEVRSVNGLELTTPDKALEAYAAVRSAPELRVELMRRGRPLRLILEILEPRTR